MPALACITASIWLAATGAHEALAARADYRRFELNAARLALAGNMATAAITRARLAAQLEATTAILCVQDEQLRLAHERVRIGQASPDEALSLQAQAEQTLAELPALRKQLQQTEHLLAVLAGRVPGTGGIQAFTLADFTLPVEMPLVVPSELVRRRPDIQGRQRRCCMRPMQTMVWLSPSSTHRST